jgi:hypothetical protein
VRLTPKKLSFSSRFVEGRDEYGANHKQSQEQ